MINRIIIIILALVFWGLSPCDGLSDSSCTSCKSTGDECWTDKYGAIYCKYSLIYYPEEQSSISYYIDKKARSVGSNAFSDNHIVQCVYIPEGVSIIEDGAFETSSIQYVRLPESLLVIGQSAFGMCHDLKEIDIPSNVYAIGRAAFVECTLLQSVTIPSSVRYIGDEAFVKTSIHDIFFETVLCCVEGKFISHTASSTGALTLHFPAYAKDDEVGDVDKIISIFRGKPDLAVLYDVNID